MASDALAIAAQIFRGWRTPGPTLKVEAEMEVGRGLVAEICKLEVELVEDIDGVQSFALRLGVDREGGEIGLHRRTLHNFDSNQYNVVELLARAFSEFSDVGEKNS